MKNKNKYTDLRVTSDFGNRANPTFDKDKPVDYNNPLNEFHPGTDFGVELNKTYAGIKGDVRLAENGNYGEGLFIQIKGIIKGVPFYVNSFHNSALLCAEGDKVEKNTVVAKPGSSGRSTGPHIHHEIFTYRIESEIVKKLVEDGVPSYISGRRAKRIFFDPRKLYEYLDKEGITY